MCRQQQVFRNLDEQAISRTLHPAAEPDKCGEQGRCCYMHSVLSPGHQRARIRVSSWLIRIIRLGYAIQRCPPGMQFTSVKIANAHVLRAVIAVLLAKDAIEPVPPVKTKTGFYSPYLIVPKKGGGLWPILDLGVLNRTLYKLPFKMLTQKCIFECIHP